MMCEGEDNGLKLQNSDIKKTQRDLNHKTCLAVLNCELLFAYLVDIEKLIDLFGFMNKRTLSGIIEWRNAFSAEPNSDLPCRKDQTEGINKNKNPLTHIKVPFCIKSNIKSTICMPDMFHRVATEANMIGESLILVRTIKVVRPKLEAKMVELQQMKAAEFDRN